MDKVSKILAAQQQLRKTSIQRRKRMCKKQIALAKQRLACLPRYSLLEELHNSTKVILLSDKIGNPVERSHRGPYLFIAHSGKELSLQRNKPWNNEKKTRKYDPKNNMVADLYTIEISLDIVRPAFHKDQPIPKYYYARPPTVAIWEQVRKVDDEVSAFSQQVNIDFWSDNRLSEVNTGREIPFLLGKMTCNKDGIYPKERSKIRETVSILSLRRE